MKSEGHTGLALLLSAPLVLGASYVVSNIVLYAFVALLIIFVNIPDIDYMLSRSFIGGITGIKHRGFTHTIYFAFVCGILSASLTVSSQAISVVTLMFASGFLGVTLHCLGDVVTPSGIKFVPWVQQSDYSLDLFNYNNAVANIGFFLIGFVSIGIVFAYLRQPRIEILGYWISLYVVFLPIITVTSIKTEIRYSTSVLSRFFNPIWWLRKLF